jgi:hypothetical protein
MKNSQGLTNNGHQSARFSCEKSNEEDLEQKELVLNQEKP